MTYKSMLAPVIALDEDIAALTAAAEIAERFNAEPTALILALHLSSSYMDEEAPLSAVLQDLAGGATSHAAQLRRGLMAWFERASRAFEVRDLAIERAVDDDKIVAHALLSDLTIFARADAHDRARRAMIEDVLFKSGRPVLLVPERPLRQRSWETIVIGWSAKAEAVRAIAGAMPFLKRAQKVVITTVDAKPINGEQRPGLDLAAYLRRHDVQTEVHNVDGLGRTEARSLLDDSIAIDADMLVLGAYGHSRAREFLFGGVTRELLTASSIPLFMAH
ncbi:MAG: universal stress protein [Hyphomonadaceae bacterium]|nr:universal stress protein [Hyphomonadaceae bacterium]